ncbi:uncharacterized protein LOC135936813 isoform X2 [Cloeon dipterum]|uniref:uncharacterized protein LOC135936813 isoform X2 n=1 Tax=Cloeon dipterum TaxID=197152 RepID=UPI0032202702
MASLREQVHPGDVIAAIKTIHGSDAHLTDYEVLKGTASVQGFMSCILRVRATCIVGNDPETKTVQFIVKRTPVLEAQRNSAARVFEQEVTFFTKCLPVLKKRCPDLKVVNCLFAHSASTIVMEDLSQQGYSTMTKNFDDLKHQILTLPQTRMVFRELAKFHAASQGTDWLKILPQYFEEDILFEVDGGKLIKQLVSNSILNCLLPIMKHIYRADPSKIQKYVDWMSDLEGNVFPVLIKANKPNLRYLNALCHGDCWLNNFMMKSHPDTGEPLDLRFIDMQIVRYAPVYSDLLYVMYLSLKSDFRAMHEATLIKTYVEQFNASCNVTPDPIKFDQFMKGYNESRFAGVLLATSMYPLVFVGDVAPPEGEDLTEENFNNLLGEEKNAEEKRLKSLRVFEEEKSFSNDMKCAVAELIIEMDKWIFHK